MTTFVPTFLATVFGIPYLAGLPMRSRPPVDLHPPSDVPREMRAMRLVGLADPPARVASTPTRQPLRNAPALATASAIPPPAALLAPPPVHTWARGPAFTSQSSAEHFATRMGRVGFPAYVRREDRPDTRWVVWIGNPD